MADLDQLLRSDISHAAARAAATPDFNVIERRGTHQRRTRMGLTAAAAAATVVVAVGGVAAVVSDDEGRQQPARDPSPSLSTSPSPSPTEATTPPTRTIDWTAQLRPDSSGSLVSSKGWLDDQDAAFGGIDILDAWGNHRPGWHIELRAAPPLAATLDPARRIVQHGVVVDADGDRVADCHIGINTDAPRPGHMRVWVADLTTGVTDERVGPPYGYPIDFFHPSEGEVGPSPRTVLFFSLRGWVGPCDRFGPEATFYAYGLVTDQGRVVARDYAPDKAWLRLPDGVR